MDRSAWLVAAVMFVVAFVGEALLHDEPDWLILLVAVAAGLVVAGLTNLVRRRDR